MRTLFLDVDGCLVYQNHDGVFRNDAPIPGAIEKIREWYGRGYYIVFTTARPEVWREDMERFLTDSRVPYHQLIMGLPARGGRVLVNDLGGSHAKPHMAAVAYEIDRNSGFGEVNL